MMSISAMSEPYKLHDMLVNVRDKKETGKLYTYYRDEAMIRIGMLFFSKGKLCGCRFDKQTGLKALRNLYQFAFTTVTFVRLGKEEVEYQGSIPDVDSVISTLEEGCETAPWKMSGTEIYQAVVATLEDILGKKGQQIAVHAARDGTSEENLEVFKQRVIDAMALFVGDKKARAILNPLFE